MTQPQPHQRPFPPEGGGVPDALDPNALERLLRLRERGPHSPALPPINFMVADHPLDLVVVLEQIIHQSGDREGVGQVGLIQALAAAANLLARVQMLLAATLEQNEPLPMSARHEGGKPWPLDGEIKQELALMLQGVMFAEHNIATFLIPLMRGWLSQHNPEGMAAGTRGDLTSAHQALVSDAILEALQIDRDEFRIATQAPTVDS